MDKKLVSEYSIPNNPSSRQAKKKILGQENPKTDLAKKTTYEAVLKQSSKVNLLKKKIFGGQKFTPEVDTKARTGTATGRSLMMENIMNGYKKVDKDLFKSKGQLKLGATATTVFYKSSL